MVEHFKQCVAFLFEVFPGTTLLPWVTCRLRSTVRLVCQYKKCSIIDVFDWLLKPRRRKIAEFFKEADMLCHAILNTNIYRKEKGNENLWCKLGIAWDFGKPVSWSWPSTDLQGRSGSEELQR
jgi:hypothetical protein